MKHFSSLVRRGPLAGLLLLLLWLAGPVARAQAPAWQRAVALSQTGSSVALVTATTSANGNVYLAGAFTGTVTLGTTTLTSTTSNFQDVFVAKWSPATDQFVWAVQAGGSQGDIANAIVADGTSIYVAGNIYSTTAGFGAITLSNAGRTDAFVAKLVDAGSSASFAWAQRAGGPGDDFATAVAVNGTSVYLGGSFGAGAAQLGGLALTGPGGGDAFVAKLLDTGSTGSFAWAQSAGSPGYDGVSALAVGSGGALFASGLIAGPAATFGSTVLSHGNSYDLFVTKLTDAGVTGGFVWAQTSGGPGTKSADALAVRGGNVYIAGSFFGATTIGGTPLTSIGNYDVYVAKLTDGGAGAAFAWAVRAGGAGYDAAYALALSGNSLYVGGTFDGVQADFGSTTLAGAGGSDVYVAKLVDAGPGAGFAWAQRAGGSGYDYVGGVALSSNGVYVGGAFQPSAASFSAITLTTLATGNTVGFLASLTDPTLTATAAAKGSPSFTLAPNPARSAATVTLPAVPGAPTATLTLLDGLGRPVRTQTVPLPAAGLRHALDLRGLPAGLYVLRVSAGAEAATRQLVVE
jgi:hypothetical protein